ncbi:MAG: hypothetical protein MUF31_04430 [Akkermansiaceae bacterium]|jgi:hypothetical protein|nr:hypothetical protein [Akkermansiaceae bacterium]
MNRTVLAALAAVALSQCASELPPTATPPIALNPATDYRVVSGNAGVDDIARFLAGRPVLEGEALSSWQVRNDSYHAHALDFDYLWRRMASQRTLRQAQYFFETTRGPLGNPNTVVYPFGGPDILHANSMFPTATTYVLLGLEDVGAVPDLASSDPTPLLGRLRTVLNEPLRYGYYITEQMRVAPPATHIMMTTLALSGAEISSVSGIDAAGRPGVEIRYRTAGGTSKRAIYVKADLSNRGFDSSLQGWLSRYSGDAAYFKAASYLPHDGNFSAVRDWVLANCRSVLQDDSGIPFRYYDSSKWETTLLGGYTSPIPVFSKFRQSDLASAYAAAGSVPQIPFGSGYHLRASEANLQIHRRR